MTRDQKIEALQQAQEQMNEALRSIECIARLDPNKEAYVFEQLDSLINTPSNRYDQSLLTWIEQLYDEADEETDAEDGEDEQEWIAQQMMDAASEG